MCNKIIQSSNLNIWTLMEAVTLNIKTSQYFEALI